MRRTVEHTREGCGHAVSPALGSCAGASPVTGPEHRGLELSVRENNHRVNEYAPGFPTTCDWVIATKVSASVLIGEVRRMPGSRRVSLIPLPVVDLEVLARYLRCRLW